MVRSSVQNSKPVDEAFRRRYARLLADFCRSASEEVLERARVLSREFVAAAIASDEIVALHARAMQDAVVPGVGPELVASQRFLLEVMITYGVTYSAIAERLLAEANTAAAVEHAHADEATRAEKERLDLLAGFSHELGTPLTVVKGNVTAIRRFLEANHSWPEGLTSRADDVEFAVERMLALREELLAASRNEQRELELVPIHLLHSLHRVVRWAQISASEKGIQLTEEDPANVPYVVGDEVAVQSVFSNVLSNAVRYTPSGGSIRVKITNEVSRVAVEVTDSGIGISEQERRRIFERFYRTQEAQQMASFGLGLGLAITRDLVSALGGTIEVSSRPGAGSTFRVTLRVANMAEDEA